MANFLAWIVMPFCCCMRKDFLGRFCVTAWQPLGEFFVPKAELMIVVTESTGRTELACIDSDEINRSLDCDGCVAIQTELVVY